MQAVAITPDSNHAAVTRLRGWAIHEDGGAVATVLLKDGASGAALVIPLEFAADQSSFVVLPKEDAIPFPDGCYVDESAGSVAGTLFTD